MPGNTVPTRAIEHSLLERYDKLSSATVHEAMGRRGAVDAGIHPLSPEMRICGVALPVRCPPGDNLSLIKAIQQAEKGDVIILDMGPSPQYAPFGEVLMTECRTKELAGLITNSCVRDTKELRESGFPVFSAGIGILGTVKRHRGDIGRAMSYGGVWIELGDLVLADADGIVVVPREEAETVCAQAEARVEKEARVMERLRQGESLFDIYDYAEVYGR